MRRQQEDFLSFEVAVESLDHLFFIHSFSHESLVLDKKKCFLDCVPVVPFLFLKETNKQKVLGN